MLSAERNAPDRLMLLPVVSCLWCMMTMVQPSLAQTSPPSTACPAQDPSLAKWSTLGLAYANSAQVVRIPANARVLLDRPNVVLRGIVVEGLLVFADQPTSIAVEHFIVNRTGQLWAGSEQCAHASTLTITLMGNKTEENIDRMFGSKVLGVASGGLIEMHGKLRKPVWTKLKQTALVGARSLLLVDPVDWVPGDQIVVSSTDFDYRQAEQFTVASVSHGGYNVTLTTPLKYMHFGQIVEGVDERAEVSLLTRNIVVKGDANSLLDNKFGGHVMVMVTVRTRFEAVEFGPGLGQLDRIGRYPVHFHLAGVQNKSYVKDCSIHHANQRCLVLHGTHAVHINNTVAYETNGHCFFLEDAIEQDNIFYRNIALSVHKGTLLPMDTQPSAYWISFPKNDLIDNVAAGCSNFGFWYAFPNRPTGLSKTNWTDANIIPYRTATKLFRGNSAHSNGVNGFHLEDAAHDGRTLSGVRYEPFQDPKNTSSASVQVKFERFTAYKNRNRGFWARASNMVVSNSLFADNAIGLTVASEGVPTDRKGEQIITGCTFVGETTNIGNPVSSSEKSLGRSLPSHIGFPIRGFEQYDGPTTLSYSTFKNFIPDATRPKIAAIASFIDDHWYTNPLTDLHNVTVHANSKPIYFPANPINDGEPTLMFIDLDGSLTGIRKPTQVIYNHNFSRTAACTCFSWNGCYCPERYGYFLVRDMNTANTNVTNLVAGRKIGATFVRDDQRGYPLVLKGAPSPQTPPPRMYYQSNVLVNRAYYVQYNHTTPISVSLEFKYGDKGHFIYAAVCYRPGTNITKVSLNSTFVMRPASSIDAFKADPAGTQYFYNRTTGWVYVKLVQTVERIPRRYTKPAPSAQIYATYPTEASKQFYQCVIPPQTL